MNVYGLYADDAARVLGDLAPSFGQPRPVPTRSVAPAFGTPEFQQDMQLLQQADDRARTYNRLSDEQIESLKWGNWSQGLGFDVATPLVQRDMVRQYYDNVLPQVAASMGVPAEEMQGQFQLHYPNEAMLLGEMSEAQRRAAEIAQYGMATPEGRYALGEDTDQYTKAEYEAMGFSPDAAAKLQAGASVSEVMKTADPTVQSRFDEINRMKAEAEARGEDWPYTFAQMTEYSFTGEISQVSPDTVYRDGERDRELQWWMGQGATKEEALQLVAGVDADKVFGADLENGSLAAEAAELAAATAKAKEMVADGSAGPLNLNQTIQKLLGQTVSFPKPEAQVTDEQMEAAKQSAYTASLDVMRSIDQAISLLDADFVTDDEGRVRSDPDGGSLFRMDASGPTAEIARRLPWPTRARDLSGIMPSIKGPVFLDALKSLRQASTNGSSGLGQVTEREISRLESQIAALDETNLRDPLLADNLLYLRERMAWVNGRITDPENTPELPPAPPASLVDMPWVTLAEGTRSAPPSTSPALPPAPTPSSSAAPALPPRPRFIIDTNRN